MDTMDWPAMGTTARVWLAGPEAKRAAAGAAARIEDLEGAWSRFRPDSDVCRLNAASGAPVAVRPETLGLLAAARAWWQATGGLFDPTILPALEAAGYDRDLATGHGPVADGPPAPGLAGLQLDLEAGTAQLPAGVRVDLGGIGKGRTVDLVADALAAHPGGLVDLGGDLRVWGRRADGDSWPIAVDDLRDGSQLALLGLRAGAVATSSMLRRCWSDGRRAAHHLIDPRTGGPCAGDLVTVTVIAGRGEAAEVLAKAALLTGDLHAARDLLEGFGVAGLLVPREGTPARAGGVEELCWVTAEGVR